MIIFHPSSARACPNDFFPESPGTHHIIPRYHIGATKFSFSTLLFAKICVFVVDRLFGRYSIVAMIQTTFCEAGGITEFLTPVTSIKNLMSVRQRLCIISPLRTVWTNSEPLAWRSLQVAAPHPPKAACRGRAPVVEDEPNRPQEDLPHQHLCCTPLPPKLRRSKLLRVPEPAEAARSSPETVPRRCHHHPLLLKRMDCNSNMPGPVRIRT
jgi:hypothetical protein